MISFFQETWQLWYWAMFFPLKLRQYTSQETSGHSEGSPLLNITLNCNNRFILQLVFLLLISSVPLATGVYMTGQPLDWLIVLIVGFIASAISSFYLPLGLHLPLFFGMFYLIQPEFLRGIFLIPAITSILNPSSFFQIWPIVFLGLVITEIIAYLFFHNPDRQRYIYKTSSIGSTLTVVCAGWLSNQDWRNILVLSLLTAVWGAVYIIMISDLLWNKKEKIQIGIFTSTMGMSILLFTVFFESLHQYQGNLVVVFIQMMALFLLGSMIFGILGFLGLIVGKVAVILFWIVAIAGTSFLLILGMIALPLPFFLLSVWGLGFCFSPSKKVSWSIVLVLMVVSFPLTWETHAWLTLLTIPVILVGYSRLLPDYLILVLLSYIQSMRLHHLDSEALLRRLYRLPPYNNYELFLLPLPLPVHTSLLCAYFKSDLDGARHMLRTRDSQPYWFQRTINNALSLLVDDELRDYLRNLANVEILKDIIIKGSAERSGLLQLVEEKQDNNLHYLDAIVRNIATELKSNSYREREELVQTSLDELKKVKSGMDIWEDVKKHWQPLLQKELELVRARLVVEELSKITIFNDLIDIAAKNRPVSSKFPPELYEFEQSDNALVSSLLDHDPTIAIFFPRLQAIASDAKQSYILEPAAQAEYALHQVLENLRSLQQQANNLELDTARRWKPVFDRWQEIVQAQIPVVQARIVIEQLRTVSTVADLSAIANPDHPVLSLLLPSYYRHRTDDYDMFLLPSTPGLPDPALPVLLPELLIIARDIGAAGEAGTAALRERNLERCLLNLLGVNRRLPQYQLDAQTVSRWRPVIEQWQKVVQLAIEQQQAESTNEVINPFQAGNPIPVRRFYLFKGRRKFADDIVRQILDHNRPILVLHGPRRCGKSSFLINLPRLLPGKVLPVYIDIQKAGATSSEVDFFYSLVRGMQRDLRGRGIQLPTIKRNDFPDDPYPVFEDWLDRAEIELQGQHILLCLDEFEKLGTAISDGRISLRVFDELRHLIQHNENIGFLFCGVQTPDQLGPNWSSYFISAKLVEMTYLDPDEAEQILIDPDPTFEIRYAPGIVEQILNLTRCQPFLLQLIGEELVKQANESQTKLITQPLLDAAIVSALTAGAAYFDDLWKEYTGETPEEVEAGQSLLMSLAKEQPLPNLDEYSVQKALQRLIRYHTIEQVNGFYRFEVPLIKHWVREKAILNYSGIFGKNK